jgi:mannitol-specific phosphotransferase system IIBC component
MIYDGNQWNLNDQSEAINDLIDTNEVVLEQKLEEWIENGKDYPEIMKKFNRYLEKKEQDEVINKIKDEIKLLLYNNRKVINDQIDI